MGWQQRQPLKEHPFPTGGKGKNSLQRPKTIFAMMLR